MISNSELRSKVLTTLDVVKPNTHCESDKEFIRSRHSGYKRDFLLKNRKFWLDNKSLIESNLVNGENLIVDNIQPKLIPIPRLDKSWKSKLFRLARFHWSIPTSNGFGRRLRFLVWDTTHDALIGIIGLTDPVFNMQARDQAIGWDIRAREERLVSVLDAYALGALPPYNRILGGKLVASLLMSKEILEEFDARYSTSKGLISGKNKKPKLAAITTTSVLGRSSVYNRLKLNNTKILRSVGYTSGYGHFHFSEELFTNLKEFLINISPEKAVSYSFGEGPNWKIRVIRDALKHLEIDQKFLKHGFKREIFISKLYENSFEHLSQGVPLTDCKCLTTKHISKLALNRWVIKRAQNDHNYQSFCPSSWVNEVTNSL
tara:strand:- start:1402 stop:2523 length:1122 start_codon:yes stop_codon:yes gene_type:complete